MQSRTWIRKSLGYGAETLTSVAVALLFFLVFIAILNLIFPVSRNGMNAAEFMKLIARDREAEAVAAEGGEVVVAALTVLGREVKTRRAAEIAWQAAATRAKLADGDAVQTNRVGSARIDFGESHEFQLGASSLLVVRERTEDAAGGSEDYPSLIVMAGELFGTVKTGAGIRPVSIVASGATARFTGGLGKEPTRFRVLTGPDRSSTLSVLSGTAQVTDGSRTVQVEAKQAVTLDPVHGISPLQVFLNSPLLREPQDRAVYTYREISPRIKLAWSAAPGAGAYRVLLGQDPKFNRVLLDQRVEGTTLLCGSLADGTYYWTVAIAADGAAEGGAAATRRFTLTRDEEPPRLAVDFPSEVVAGQSLTITGVTEPGARVFVAGRKAAVDKDGHFRLVVRVGRGANVILVEAIDPAGNASYTSEVVEARF